MPRSWRVIWLALIWVLVCGVAAAQGLPGPVSTTVNDFAKLLSAEQAAQLQGDLSALKRETGIEMTVVTLQSQASYAPNQSMESFATRLFNHWGVGDAGRNDGIMVLVLPGDRAMRIELGAGYARAWDRVAQRIVDDAFLPRFRAGTYGTGILLGSAAVIEDIARPFHDGAEASGGRSLDGWWLALIALGFGLFTQYQWLIDRTARLRRCPQCGAKGGLRVQRRVVTPATTTLGGQKSKTTTCAICGYEHQTTYQTPKRSKGGSGGFGGGSSGGGGASGRW